MTNLEALEQIDPSHLDYSDWLNMGMIFKHEGGTCEQWDRWSMRDFARYTIGDCEKHWASFKGKGAPVTMGTAVMYAKQQGISLKLDKPHEKGKALAWDATIGGGKEEYKIVNEGWLENADITEPTEEEWKPVQQLKRYIEAVYQEDDHVAYNIKAVKRKNKAGEEKWLPADKGTYHRTAKEILADIEKYPDDLGYVIGDYNPEAGVWIRPNPFDGQGVRDGNVTDYRYALVEADEMELGRQLAIYKELELPCAAIVHSGGKSLHAIVRIDADNMKDYRERVDFLYKVMEKNDFDVDAGNKNPSRLSRLPGVVRNGKKQFIIATNCGKETWSVWHEWMEAQCDDLPDEDLLENYYNELPKLSDPIIHGVLRKNHKMLIVGPSKAGKSFLQIYLTIAVAEGIEWLGWKCAQGKVLYINLELDRASCLHRFKYVYDALGIPPKNIKNIVVWNLRGRAERLDKLAPKLIRRAKKQTYSMIIFDPIYKIVTGDENAADQMSMFCNQFDKICHDLNVATVYCHHHSKGSQGQKQSHDRASGSGVFARDPDALIDMIQLNISEDILKQMVNKSQCASIAAFLEANGLDNWREKIGRDDSEVAKNFRHKAVPMLPESVNEIELSKAMNAGRERAEKITAWRLEGTLREFETFKPRDIWFEYPKHSLDETHILKEAVAVGEFEHKKPKEIKSKTERDAEKLTNAFSTLKLTHADSGKPITVFEMAAEIKMSEKTAREWLNRCAAITGLNIEKGNVFEVPKKGERKSTT